MKTIRLYRHPDCARCARLSRRHRRLDWLGRLEDSTEMPPTGPLRLGEIAVQDLRTGATARGAESIELLCRHIPAYWPMLMLLPIPVVHDFVERQTRASDWLGP